MAPIIAREKDQSLPSGPHVEIEGSKNFIAKLTIIKNQFLGIISIYPPGFKQSKYSSVVLNIGSHILQKSEKTFYQIHDNYLMNFVEFYRECYRQQ